MKPVRKVVGRAVPLDRSDVDTDQIIPSEWLKRVERTGFGKGLFSEWREDPDFVLNQPQFLGASILVAGANFGSGSSREHAVWALTDYGFDAVIAPSFADIFRTNATKNGLVPAEIAASSVNRLLGVVLTDPSVEIVVDVEALVVSVPAAGIQAPFHLDPSVRQRFLEGLDDIGITLRHGAAIEQYETIRPLWMPSVTPA